MTARIRPFEADDWDDICSIHDQARPDELRGSCDPEAFVPIEQDQEVEDLRACQKLVAVEAGEVVGFVGVDDDYIGWLYVAPSHYRRGIGRQLLRSGLELTGNQATTIVLAGNLPAIELYRSEGFRLVRRFESDNAGYPCTCLRMARGPAARHLAGARAQNEA
ncbi:MAG: GNAT family N-acetyltransferase [Anaerolineales bacterium]